MKKKQAKGFSVRQIKYKNNRLLGMNQLDAAIAAGYSETYAKQACRVEKLVKVSIIDELNRAGATDQAIAKELYDIAFHAIKIQSCTLLVTRDSDGKTKINENSNDFIEVTDTQARLKAMDLIVELKKHLSNQVIVDNSKHEHAHYAVINYGSRSQEPANNTSPGIRAV